MEQVGRGKKQRRGGEAWKLGEEKQTGKEGGGSWSSLIHRKVGGPGLNLPWQELVTATCQVSVSASQLPCSQGAASSAGGEERKGLCNRSALHNLCTCVRCFHSLLTVMTGMMITATTLKPPKTLWKPGNFLILHFLFSGVRERLRIDSRIHYTRA